MIAVCQDCSSPRKALIKCLPEHCWGDYIIGSKISARHHFGWIPHSSSLWEGESISSIFLSLDIGNNFGPWNIPRRTPAISKHRVFASFLLLQWNIWHQGVIWRKGLLLCIILEISVQDQMTHCCGPLENTTNTVLRVCSGSNLFTTWTKEQKKAETKVQQCPLRTHLLWPENLHDTLHSKDP